MSRRSKIEEICISKPYKIKKTWNNRNNKKIKKTCTFFHKHLEISIVHTYYPKAASLPTVSPEKEIQPWLKKMIILKDRLKTG